MRIPSTAATFIASLVAATIVLLLQQRPSAQVFQIPGASHQAVGPHLAASALQGGGLPAQASPLSSSAVSTWLVPDPDTLPADDVFTEMVRRGRDLITKTSSLIGPDAPNPAMRFAGNGLTCQSCHLQAGTQQYGLPLAGVWGIFPQYIGRENEVRTLEERVNGCMERSVNGRALPVDSPEMKAIITYIRFISGLGQVGRPVEGRGTLPLPLPDRAADPGRGRQIFVSNCAICHGENGQGQRLEAAEAVEQGKRYQVPPLWGPDSYNDGAGMARTITAARFVHANMPFGTTWTRPQIPAMDAYDVMAFVNSQPRPHRENLEADYPDLSKKPVDAAYPPFVGPFPPDQHRYGPWKPIQEWLRSSGAETSAALRETP